MSHQDSQLRSLVKGLSWRATGSIDTLLIALLVTHDFSTAFKIGAVEVFTKITLYYFHERVWQKIKWGQPIAKANTIWNTAQQRKDAPLRSIVKGISWRATGTVDTILISYFITNDVAKALAIGGVEVFTKLVLYYFHERLWQKIKWGAPNVATTQTHRVGAEINAISP